MTNSLQFAIEILSVEDRLRLRIRFADGVEVQLLLTRRFVKGLFELTEKMSEAIITGDLTPEQKSSVAEFDRAAAVDKGDFQTPYQRDQSRPHPEIGDQALLVEKLNVHMLQSGNVKLEIFVNTKRCLSFELPQDGLWGFVHLIGLHATKAGWDLTPPNAETADNSFRSVN